MKRATTQTAVERLALDLSDRDPDDPMADQLLAWLSGSARFRAFAEANHDKIRKKFRTATDPEALLDVRAELQVARLMLADRRFDLSFEAYGSGKLGPDFTITFRGARSFNLEVTRLRRLPTPGSAGSSLLTKLRQLPPSASNAVLLAIDDAGAALDIDATVRALRARADAKDEPFFAKRGLESSRGFYDRFLRLGGVFVWCEAAAGDARASLWVNRSARIALPDRASRATLDCLRAGR